MPLILLRFSQLGGAPCHVPPLLTVRIFCSCLGGLVPAKAVLLSPVILFFSLFFFSLRACAIEG